MKTPLKSRRNRLASLFLCSVLLALLFSAKAGATPLCIRLKTDAGGERSLPVKIGGSMRLSFRHSIYGSQVDEVFSLRPGGFELTQVRFGEARLAEFYGYEIASRDNDVWVVTPRPVLLSSLKLNLSADAAMSLYFDQSPYAKQLVIQPGSALSLAVESCDQSANG